VRQKRYEEITSEIANVKILPGSASVRHNQKELAQASNPEVLPFSVDAPETKTTLSRASASESTFRGVVQSAA